MLEYLEEHLETPEEAGVQVYIASLARCDAQRLVELERRCQELMQDVKLSSER